MYKIFADNTLIYDSTFEDYKIGKGSITLETNKSGSFTFSIYPDHFFYDKFIRLRTVITVYRSGKIIFRGRILNDVSDYWNNKVITCEGELGFLQDSVIRPFQFSGTPEDFLKQFIEEHNSQVDDFKKFKVGECTVVDSNDRITRSSGEYNDTLSALSSRTISSTLGGYFYITHGEDGTEEIPTLNYLSDFTNVSTQSIEFGHNLKNYTKTVKASDIATAIIPLGHDIDDGDDATENEKLTIASVNDGIDYVYSEEAVALYGWIFKTVEFGDITIAANLKAKAEAYLQTIIQQNITIELNAVDLNLLDPTIESINVGDYVRAISTPHNMNITLLCSKQTIDILNPENDSFTLGYTHVTATELNNQLANDIKSNYVTNNRFTRETSKTISAIKQTEASIKLEVESLEEKTKTQIDVEKEAILLSVSGEYETKSNAQTNYASLDSRIQATASSILLLVSASYATKDDLDGYATYGDVSNVEGRLELKIDKDDNDQIVSMLNASASVINITSNRLTIDSTNFSLSADGTVVCDGITARNGDFSGTFSNSNGLGSLEISGAELVATQSGSSARLWSGHLQLTNGAWDITYGPNGFSVGSFSCNASTSDGGVAFVGNDNYIRFASGQANLTGTWTSDSAISVTSDANKKHDIKDITDAYSLIFDNLKPRLYKYNDGTSDRIHVGFIAQEVEEAILASGLTTQDFAAFVRAEVPNVETGETETVCLLRYEEFIALNTLEIQKLKVAFMR